MILAKFWKAIRAWFNKQANGLRAADPVAQYRLIIDEATEKIVNGKESLGKFKGHVLRLQREKAAAEADVKKYSRLIDLALQAGKDEEATKWSINLKQSQTTLDTVSANLASFEAQYAQQVAMMKASQEQISKASEECRVLGYQLEMSKANKEAAAIAAEFGDSIKNPLGDLASIRNEIRTQIDGNNAMAEVNVDLGLTEDTASKEAADMETLEAQDFIAQRKKALGLIKDAPVAVQQAALPHVVTVATDVIPERTAVPSTSLTLPQGH